MKPNFFIVGAPKCGTTALSEYLRGHPNIFLSEPKEPHYFSEDMDQHRYVKTLDDYLKLFQPATSDQIMVGEASVGYLFSSVAIKNIRKFNPEAKIIAMIRNPVDMILSHHRQLLFSHYENEPDFEKAWRLQAERRLGNCIPPDCRAPMFLQYAESGKLGLQIKRLMQIFPPEQIKIVVFDDMVSNTAKVYQEILNFLELPHDGRDTFGRINEAKQPRFIAVSKLIAKTKPFAVSLALKIRALSGINVLPLMKKATALNEVKIQKESISGDLRQELIRTYRDDVLLLSSLANRDLSAWIHR
jgi:hypothetical protein